MEWFVLVGFNMHAADLPGLEHRRTGSGLGRMLLRGLLLLGMVFGTGCGSAVKEAAKSATPAAVKGTLETASEPARAARAHS